ncbi:MAG TPA: 2',3'-cyclic-nucleotide 2'-phosphodiesterase, partial [Maritimibacter sp.]|nr:2',3'-cyclic-nucleotide 2'-phosphodiesterase [Maritimibacter sp.]
MIAAMNHLRYDAATLGNHDFDRGVDVLLSAIEQADFPIVSSNTVLEKGNQPIHDSTFVPPYAIINRAFENNFGEQQLVRIGVIGFLPPNSIHAGADQGLTPETRDIIEAAKSFVPRLRAKGVDLVVAVAHTGIGAAPHTPGMENAIVPLCEIEGIDAVIGGHSHQIFPRPETGTPPSEHQWFDQAEVDSARGLVNGVPVVIPGFWGSHLGVIDLELEEHPDGWAIVTPPRAAPASSLREVSNEDSQAIEPVTPEFSELLGQLH